MLLQVLGHLDDLDLLLSKDWGHGFIGSELQLVLRVQEIVVLKVVPKLLDNLGKRVSV